MKKDLTTKTIILEHRHYDSLKEYLLRHEQDIALGCNDFSDLSELFEAVIGRDPLEINA